jgi:glucokinase
MYAIGIDIGGTKIAGALVDPHGGIIRESRVPTPAQDSNAIADSVVALIQELSEGVEVMAAGIAVAGFIDADRANIIYSPNLSFRNEPFKAKLQARLDMPVFIENDANAAGWAEFRFGAGRDVKHMAMFTIGTGVGGAIVVDGQLLRGGFGIAGELGHVRLIPDGRLCGCGQKGCLEQYGSGTALLRAAKDLVASGNPKSARLAELQIEAGELTGVQVYQAITERDSGAMGLLEELGTLLGQAAASLVAVLDPEVIVIGGGVSAAGNLLLDPIEKAFDQHLPASNYRPHLRFAIAEFVNDAGVVGAADLARREVTKQ